MGILAQFYFAYKNINIINNMCYMFTGHIVNVSRILLFAEKVFG